MPAARNKDHVAGSAELLGINGNHAVIHWMAKDIAFLIDKMTEHVANRTGSMQ